MEWEWKKDLEDVVEEVDIDCGYVVIDREEVSLYQSLTTCSICGGLLSEDLEDFVVAEDTCRRGCCHYGWTLYIRGEWEYTIFGNYWCEECYINRKEILSEKILERLPDAEEDVRDEIQNTKEKIKQLESEIEELEQKKATFETLAEKYSGGHFSEVEIAMLRSVDDYLLDEYLDVYEPLITNWDVDEDGRVYMEFEELSYKKERRWKSNVGVF